MERWELLTRDAPAHNFNLSGNYELLLQYGLSVSFFFIARPVCRTGWSDLCPLHRCKKRLTKARAGARAAGEVAVAVAE